MTANEKQRGLETWSIIITVIIALLLVVLASLSMRLDWLLPLALSAGALAGC